MISSRQLLLQELQLYSTSFREEALFIQHFLELLTLEHCYYRDHLPGHITGSAMIVDEARENCLLTHHAKLNRWLQPGGHADGDENIFRVALREAEEETGLKQFTVLSSGLFDIDIHSIPERKNFPQHLHYDVRFAFVSDSNLPLRITEESHALAWVPINELISLTGGNNSILRMSEKIRAL